MAKGMTQKKVDQEETRQDDEGKARRQDRQEESLMESALRPF